MSDGLEVVGLLEGNGVESGVGGGLGIRLGVLVVPQSHAVVGIV